MLLHLRLSRFILGSCLLWAGLWGEEANAQPLIWSDADLPQQRVTRPLAARSGLPDTLTVTAAMPFFDDFAAPGDFPDSNRWFVPPTLIDVPQRTQGMAIAPPSLGVVTFDGNSRLGEPYNISNLVAGPADRLFSHYLDLSGYTAASQLRLSFALQPQGRGDAPEANDSFLVYFRTPDAPPQDFVKVLAVPGTPLRSFQMYEIALDDPRFFHPGFQLRFESHGSLNGALDHWHLDYVYLAPGRVAGDTAFQDQGIAALIGSPLAPYTALPLQQYEAMNEPMADFEVLAANRTGIAVPRSLRVELREGLNGSPLQPVFSREENPFLAPFAATSVPFTAFSRQSLPGLSALDLTAYLNGSDAFASNDTLVQRFRLDSLFAWDDDLPDAAFGLNQPRSYGIQLDLARPDSLTAVWLRFSPLVHYNAVTGQATYLSGQSFRLAVWSAAHPDSLLVQQTGGMAVEYGDPPGSFVRYALSRPLPVSGTVWVGLQQTNAIPLGLGFDRNYRGPTVSVFDSVGQLVPLRIPGVLMIRPELYNTRPLPAGLAEAPTLSGPRLYPHPVQAPRLTLAWPATSLPGHYEATLRDPQGRTLGRWTGRIWPGQAEVLALPPQLAPGIYLWETRWTAGVTPHRQATKLHLRYE